jgi:SAM-dependent methyltransferase
VGVSASRAPRAAPTPAPAPPAEVLWHDLECGDYGADLPLWRELAAQASPQPGAGSILEIGSGSGRVALELARGGHRVSAVELRPALLEALRERAADVGVEVEAVCADARTLALARRDHALCLVPMQTLQLLGGSAGRGAFLARAHAHLRPGALLACAIVTEFEPFDCDAGDPAPAPERADLGARRYESRPISVRVDARTIVIVRERRILARGAAAPAPAVERDVVELDRLSPALLLREGLAAGFSAAGERSIAPTEDHVGSAVVMLRA